MLEVAVYNTDGRKVDTLEVDEQALGGKVNVDLLKQAIVTYHANSRQGNAATRSRSQVEGSTRKLFRQKGTGRARRGPVRTNVLRGGGVAFAKTSRDFRKALPKKMRLKALGSAILAKILGGDLVLVDELSAELPKTAQMAAILKNLKIERSCVLTLAGSDRNIFLSSRNIQDLTVRTAADLNAFDVVTRPKMLATAETLKFLCDRVANRPVAAEVSS